MKYTFLSILLLAASINWETSIYTKYVQPVDGGEPISLASFANKKIVIATITAASPIIGQLRWLDSLQHANVSLKIIAVPAIDLGLPGSDAVLAALKTGLSLEYVITKSARVKKAAGDNQHPLFKWLTHVAENSHFDKDVETGGQLFFVSRNGKLYSVLDKNAPAAVLLQVVNQVVNQ